MPRQSAALKRDVPGSTRYHDKSADKWVVKVLPGGYHVTKNADGSELISTVLGSCVSACIWDPVMGLGGMNHFMLPHDDAGVWGGASLAMRYGNHAMESLVNELLKAGADKRRLQVKFFGGGNVMQRMRGVGDQNADFARRYAEAEGLNVLAWDLGGDRGRRIMFDPESGKVWRKFLSSSALGEVTEVESSMHKAPPLRKKPVDIELF